MKTALPLSILALFVQATLAQNLQTPTYKGKDKLAPNHRITLQPNQVHQEAHFKQIIQKEKNYQNTHPNWRPFKGNQLSKEGVQIPKNKGLARLHRIFPTQGNTVYAATSLAGLWRSKDKGLHWEDLTAAKIAVTQVWAVAEAPNNANTIIFGDDDGLYQSTDAGRHWKKVLDKTLLVRDIYFSKNQPQHVFAATESGLYKSLDQGGTWRKIHPAKANAMALHPTNSSIIYVSALEEDDLYLYISKDAGNSFTKKALPKDPDRAVGRSRIAVSKAKPDHVYLITTNQKQHGFGGLYTSTNQGNSWQLVGKKGEGEPYATTNPNMLGYDTTGAQAGGQLDYCFAFSVNQDNPLEMYVAGVSLWKTIDGGQSWKNHASWYPTANNINRHLHADIHDVVAIGEEIWVAHDGGISYSKDRSKNFEDRSSNINALEILGLDLNFYHPQQMVSAAMHVGSQYYTPKLGGWFPLGGADDNYCGFGIAPQQHVIHGANYIYNRLLWQTNINQSQHIASLPQKEPNGSLGLHQSNHNLLFQGLTKYNGTTDNDGSTLYRSEDFGSTWQLVLKDEAHSDDGRGHNARGYASKSKVVGCWNNPNKLYYKNGSRIYTSLDRGKSWNLTYNFNTTTDQKRLKSRVYKSRVLDIAVAQHDDNLLYISLRNGFKEKVVLRSLDGGLSWEDFSTGIPEAAGRVNSLALQRGSNGAIYAGTQKGVYFRDKNMAAWAPYHQGLPLTDVVSLLIDYQQKQLVAGTFGRGIWMADLQQPSQPDLRITYSNNKLTQGEELQLADYSVLNFKPKKYQWTLKGPKTFTANQQHPVFNNLPKGNYKVRLSIWDEKGKKWKTELKETITVTP